MKSLAGSSSAILDIGYVFLTKVIFQDLYEVLNQQENHEIIAFLSQEITKI